MCALVANIIKIFVGLCMVEMQVLNFCYQTKQIQTKLGREDLLHKYYEVKLERPIYKTKEIFHFSNENIFFK